VLLAACHTPGEAGTRDGSAFDPTRADSTQARAVADSTQWPTYGRDLANTRYSPLSQITVARVFAIDARTGRSRWEYVHSYSTTVDCCGPINKGVTVYGGRVFMATAAARVVALDAKTGAKLWDVKAGDNEAGYHMTPARSRGRRRRRCHAMNVDSHRGDALLVFALPASARATR
jgi:glucose dehydrogenase